MLLQGGADTLADGARTQGWPPLRDLAGTFVIMLSGAEELLRTYAFDPRNRLAFADVAFDGAGRDDTTPPAPDPNRIFLNYCLTAEHAAIWTKAFATVAPDPAVILRGYDLNNSALFAEALDAGVHLLATDNIATNQVNGTEPFVRRRTLAALAETADDNEPSGNG